jgi:hypothetical protein
MASKKGGSGKGRNVRRYDRNGNPYFVNRETGKRVSRETWQRERDRLARQREREERAERRSPSVPVTPPPAAEPPVAPPPFPPGVTEYGEPIDYEYDDDAFAVEGEDDT